MTDPRDERVSELERQILRLKRSRSLDTLAWIGVFIIVLAGQIGFGWLAFRLIENQRQELGQLQIKK